MLFELYLIELRSISLVQFYLSLSLAVIILIYNFYLKDAHREFDLLKMSLLDTFLFGVIFFVLGGSRNYYQELFIVFPLMSFIYLDKKSFFQLLIVAVVLYFLLALSFFPFSPRYDFIDPVYLFGGFVVLSLLLLKVKEAEVQGIIRLITEQEKINKDFEYIGSMTSVLCHRIGTPLNILRLKVDRIVSGKLKESELGFITEAQAEIEQLVNEIRQNSLLYSEKNLNTKVSLRELIYNLNLDDVEFILNVDDVFIESNESILKAAMRDLIKNSVEAGATKVSVSTKRESKNKIQLFVVDNGTGFSEDYFQNIDRPYFSTKNNSNLGIGLYNLRNYMRILGGKLLLKNVEEGACVVLEFWEYEK